MIKDNELLSGWSPCITDPPMAARVNLPIDLLKSMTTNDGCKLTSKSMHKSKCKSM